MKVVLDAGALIGIDRNDRRMLTAIKVARANSVGLVSVAPVVGQAWRNGARQAVLSRWIPWIDVRITELDDAKDAGELLAKARTSDVVDELLCLEVNAGDQVFTSDVTDIKVLLEARNIRASIILT
jgi:hypothetical protein